MQINKSIHSSTSTIPNKNCSKSTIFKLRSTLLSGFAYVLLTNTYVIKLKNSMTTSRASFERLLESQSK